MRKLMAFVALLGLTLTAAPAFGQAENGQWYDPGDWFNGEGQGWFNRDEEPAAEQEPAAEDEWWEEDQAYEEETWDTAYGEERETEFGAEEGWWETETGYVEEDGWYETEQEYNYYTEDWWEAEEAGDEWWDW